MIFYAKSDQTTLQDHTRHVVIALRMIAPAMLPGITHREFETAVHGAILHDMGKAHPFFQESLSPGFDRNKYQFEVPHRHEISSLLFLPLFAQEEWPQLIDMVVAHHKSLRTISGKRGRGLMDLIDDYGFQAVYERHAGEWEKWHTKVFEEAMGFDMPTRELGRQEIRNAFEVAVEYCDLDRYGRNRWRGLLMAADHLASALQEETEGRLERLFRVPDLTVFDKRASEASTDLYPLAKKRTDSNKPHTLVIAPTGAGKTDFLLRRCHGGRVFYLLPFQASINAMFLRMEEMLNGVGEARLPTVCRTDIRRVHAAAQIEIDGEIEEEQILQRHPGASLKIMTPHQVASLVFGLSGHEAMMLDIAGQNVILDEIHVYSDQAQAMTLEIVRTLVRLGCRVHIGSATIPSALARELRECLGGCENIHEIRLEDEELRSYDRHIICRLDDEKAACEYVHACVEAGKRILFISNRVTCAQARFKWACQEFQGIPILLLHSRFRREDRARIEGQIMEFDKIIGPCIVCSTQVVEVSLDISFDTLVTDCAPFDSLIQRFGRVNRRRRHAAERTTVQVGVIAPPNSGSEAKPYCLDVLRRSWAALPENNVLHEMGLQEIIDSVYPILDRKKIDVELIEVDGQMRLPELCNRPRSALLEALEIDSATVILDCDVALYRSSRGEQRQRLEIPVSINALRSKLKLWPQIEVGNRPFVCPDTCYNAKLGLMLDGEGEPVCIIL